MLQILGRKTVKFPAIFRRHHGVKIARQLLDPARKMAQCFRQILQMATVAEEPQSAALDEMQTFQNHFGLGGIGNLVVECFDGLPELHQTEYLAGGKIGADNVRQGGAGFFVQTEGETRSNPVDHAINDMGGDNFATQRMVPDGVDIALS